MRRIIFICIFLFSIQMLLAQSSEKYKDILERKNVFILINEEEIFKESIEEKTSNYSAKNVIILKKITATIKATNESAYIYQLSIGLDGGENVEIDLTIARKILKEINFIILELKSTKGDYIYRGEFLNIDTYSYKFVGRSATFLYKFRFAINNSNEIEKIDVLVKALEMVK